LSDSKQWGIATALGEDRYGNLLLGDRFCAGVRTLAGRRIVASPLYGAVSGIVQAILLDSAGDEWFGTTTGLFHARAGKVECVKDDLPGTRVRCLLETAPGYLWIGTDKGPALLTGGLVKPFPSNAVWKFGAVSSLAGDEQGNVWISTLNSGIVRYANGTFRKFDQSDGLPTDVIFSLDAFDSSYLWLRTDAGLLRISKESLLRGPTEPKRELKIAQFDEGDGLPSKQMSPQGNQGMFHFPNETTWFSSLGGIASVPPGILDRAVSRPRAVIEEHVTDASSLGFSEPSGIVVKPNEASLEIRYTALGSFRPEQVKFRYQLAGLDETWVPVQNRRAAFYTHLPPGDYVFRVQAADGDEGEWNRPEARIGVRVLTPFYRSWWMKSLVLLALLTAAAAAIEMRRRRMLEAQRVHRAFTHRLISSQENERKRIAHELHDGLGQHLALIRTLALLPAKLRTTHRTNQATNQGTAPLSEVADSDSLASIADQAAIAIHEVEAICYGLRPYQLDRLGLTKAVRSLLRKLEEGNTLVLRSSVDEIDGFFPRDQEITFYRILQEGISNILKHAEATEAEIVVACNGSKLQLRIEDNGRGFSMTAAETAGESLGLPGIAERAEALGGRAAIESSERAGTRILVEVTRTWRVRDTEEL
jgi:signal transduction histidine kinase